MNISCKVDKKPVQFKTSGHMFVYEILEGIIKRAGK